MTDLTVWEVSPVNTVIDHVISRYHNTHRAQLEELVPLAHKIASTSPDGFPAELPELLEYIQNELLMHMMKEERMLFPMAKQGLGSRAAMPVNVMMHEHEEHDRALAQLKNLPNHFTPPQNADKDQQRLYALAQELSDDLEEHIHLENEILFPRILAS